MLKSRFSECLGRREGSGVQRSADEALPEAGWEGTWEAYSKDIWIDSVLKAIDIFGRDPHISSKRQKKAHFRSNTSLIDYSGLIPHPKHSWIAFISFQTLFMLPTSLVFTSKCFFLSLLVPCDLLALIFPGCLPSSQQAALLPLGSMVAGLWYLVCL